MHGSREGARRGTTRMLVGGLHVVMGLMALVPVMILTAVFGGVWGLVAYATHGHEAATVLGIGLAAILMIVVFATGILGALGILAGAGVLLEQKWGDVLATVVAALHLFNVPLGTVLALYTFWGLWLSDGSARLTRGTETLQTSPLT